MLENNVVLEALLGEAVEAYLAIELGAEDVTTFLAREDALRDVAVQLGLTTAEEFGVAVFERGQALLADDDEDYECEDCGADCQCDLIIIDEEEGV